MMKLAALSVVLCLAALPACAAAHPSPAALPSTPLLDARGSAVDAAQLASQAPLTTFVFFSRGCHCLHAHEARLLGLYADFHPRGVALVMVDSEVGASPQADADEAAKRAYPFPILVDRGGKLAAAFGAEYATYSVVVDRAGRVLYRGGLDSDTTHLRDDAKTYLRDALEDALAGKPPRVAETEALGCSLQRW